MNYTADIEFIYSCPIGTVTYLFQVHWIVCPNHYRSNYGTKLHHCKTALRMAITTIEGTVRLSLKSGDLPKYFKALGERPTLMLAYFTGLHNVPTSYKFVG